MKPIVTINVSAAYDTREQLKHLLPYGGNDHCACGRVKSTAHPLCPACARYAGPNVIVVDPDGTQRRECGLPSVTETIRNALSPL